MFYWRERPQELDDHFWMRRVYGERAFATVNQDGYLSGVFDGAHILAHHAAFAIMTGEWLYCAVDHINGDRQDNRWINLRPAVGAANNRNRGPRKGKKYVGIYWNESQSEWRATIQVGEKKVFLGAFKTEGEAAEAFDRASVRKSGKYARLNFPEKRSEYEAYLGPIGRGSNCWMLSNYVQ